MRISNRERGQVEVVMIEFLECEQVEVPRSKNSEGFVSMINVPGPRRTS